MEEQLLSAYDTYGDAVFRYCYARTGDREEAKDIAQETFTRTWKYLADGRTIDQMQPFLYRIARNIIIDHYRRQPTASLDSMIEQGLDVMDERAVDPLVSAQATQAIRATSRLDAKYRDAVLLRYVEDLPPREIAKILGANENTISIRIHRGLEQLKKLLGTDHD